jgi:hypothetical protein
MGQIVYGTPEDTCMVICPYSKTKLLFGSEIRSATAKDGQRYFEPESAFLYRKELAANVPSMRITIRFMGNLAASASHK